ncbi:MAG: FkbM family methyltransferase [Bacteroidota bacterium]
MRRPFEKELSALRYFSGTRNGIFLDIGANSGFAVDTFLLFGQDITIHSFEPVREIARSLSVRYRHLPQVIVHQYGLGEGDGTFRIYTPSYRGVIFHPLSSLIKEHADEWLREGMIFGFKERDYTIESSECSIKRLDDLGLAPTFIKMDVQGSELSVLKGGEETLRRSRPVLYIGSVRDEVRLFLNARKYQHFIFDTHSLMFRKTEGNEPNSFFIPDEKLHEIIQNERLTDR